MFDTRNELLNLVCIVAPMSLIFLDPDGTIGQGDLANHNRLYMGFDFSQSVVVGGFAGKSLAMYDEEEEWFL